MAFLSDLFLRSYFPPNGPFTGSSSEDAMQSSISRILTEHNVPHEREYKLSGIRADLFIPTFGLAIELKSADLGERALTQQLRRYLTANCRGILLVTVSSRHQGMLESVKPFPRGNRSGLVKPMQCCWIPPHTWTPEELREPALREIEELRAKGVDQEYISSKENLHTRIQCRLEPMFDFEYIYDDPHLIVISRCTLIHTPTGECCAFGVGESSTTETKFAWGQGHRVCPECGLRSIRRSSYPPRWDPDGEPGWYCNGTLAAEILMAPARSSGDPETIERCVRELLDHHCDAQFALDDIRVTTQQGSRVPTEGNGNPHYQLRYKAQERALRDTHLKFTATQQSVSS